MNFKVLWIAGLMLAATAGQVQAGFVNNGGFETGLSGWTTSGLVSTTSSYDDSDPTYFPVEGTQFAVLVGGSQNVYATISQTFSASVGEVLSGSAFFQANDWIPFNDDGYVKIIENGHVLFQSSVEAVGDFRSTPWTTFTYTFTGTGSYTIEAGVRNVGDNTMSSALGLDNLQISSAHHQPEPASIVMWSLGGLGMMIARRKRQKRNLTA
jgi:hypothetical protein